MLKRKAYKELLEWKSKYADRTALLVNGVRRVGKSYLCKLFGENEYKSYLMIDFANVSAEIKDLFENESYNLDLFFIKLSAFYGVTLYERDSLLIFDEIQMLPRARQLIKYLVADGRYDYIETGSLLSIKRNVENIVIPSEGMQFNLYPLDFEEFLWAMGDEVTANLLRSMYQARSPLGDSLHRKVMNDFRQYLLVGGMPQAVDEYLKTKDFAKVDLVKKNILNLYRNDIAKFAGENQNKVLAIFDQIPGQLSKKEKKYNIATIDKKARYRDYENSFLWLADAMISNICYNSTDPSVALSLTSDYNTRKCYMADTGLLIRQILDSGNYTDNDLYKAVLFDRLNINEGMLMENIVAQSLVARGYRLFFYSRYDNKKSENRMEIDFLIIKNNKVIPIEVKSAGYRKHSSLDKFRLKFKNRVGEPVILYQKDLMIKEGVLHLPIYMAMLL